MQFLAPAWMRGAGKSGMGTDIATESQNDRLDVTWSPAASVDCTGPSCALNVCKGCACLRMIASRLDDLATRQVRL